jgi:hypothetical protein
MRLIPDWRKVLRHAWSVKLMFLAAILTGLEFLLPLIDQISPWPIPPQMFAGFGFFVVVAAFVSRFWAQKKLSGSDE